MVIQHRTGLRELLIMFDSEMASLMDEVIRQIRATTPFGVDPKLLDVQISSRELDF